MLFQRVINICLMSARCPVTFDFQFIALSSRGKVKSNGLSEIFVKLFFILALFEILLILIFV